MLKLKKDVLMSRSVISVITWITRIIVGGVFALSGFVKGIDPWGTIYKFEDYLAAMGLDIWYPLVIMGAWGLCALEFIVGIFIAFGSFRRSIPWIAAIIMFFMLPLTLWIALSDPVSDCGCFGDAFIISNWATFWKNVLLSICIVWLICYNRRVHWLVTPALQWLAFTASVLFIGVIEVIGYYGQPLLDFRPYKVSTVLISESSEYDTANEPQIIFIYEKDGVKKEFLMDNLPDEEDGWQFVNRKETNYGYSDDSAGNDSEADEKNLRMWDYDEVSGEETDITEEVIDNPKLLLITIPDLPSMSIASSWKINSLYSWTIKNGVEMVAVASGSQKDIDTWKDVSMAEYPIYTSEDTIIKELCRGNPGVVYVEDGIIQWKTSLRAIDVDDFLSPDTSLDTQSFRRDGRHIILNIFGIYLAAMTVLVIGSFLPKVRMTSALSKSIRMTGKLFKRKNKK